LTTGAAPGLRGIGHVERFDVIDFELVYVSHSAPRAFERPEGPAIPGVVEDGSISKLHLLISVLTFSRVVETTVISPLVVVAVFLARCRVEKDEDVGAFARRPDPTLATTAKFFVESNPDNVVSRTESPTRIHANILSSTATLLLS